jgi:hypothetical protein
MKSPSLSNPPVIAVLCLIVSTNAIAQQIAILPNHALTPGMVRTVDVEEICSSGTRELRRWSRERDDRILAEYGLPEGPHPNWEIDHSIPLGIGGSDEDSNEWPQPRRSIEPVFNAELKDRLEYRLRQLVCSG